MAAGHISPFGEHLRRFREAACLSQEDLAERAGLRAKSISALERGERQHPYPYTVTRLAEALGLAERDGALLRAAALRRSAAVPVGPAEQPGAQLPVPPTAFIGHARDVAAVRDRLLQPATRLLTLTGPGGIGKTRLALEVADAVQSAFPDGVYFVNLAPLTDSTLVLPTLAHTLRLTESASRPLSRTLHSFLSEKRLLLLLDNFEQVLGASAGVAELLAVCPRLRVLVTSRASLRLRGERVVTVPPLRVPDARNLPPLPELSQNEAIRLFSERAQDIVPDFALTGDNARAVAEICVRLDGLPLAIELAAARLRLFSPQALVARLGSRLTLLTGGARDLPARQQTLRATLDWSYDLLPSAERTLFARLAVFQGGCSPEAVDAVCNPSGALDLLTGLASLIEHSLLRQEPGAAGEPRYVLLETIREYADERLAASGEKDAICRQHAAHFLELVEEADTQLGGPTQAAWLARLEAEHDNLRAVLNWSRETSEREIGLRLGSVLARFWGRRGHFSEGRQWLEELLTQTGGTHPLRATTLRAKALLGAGELAWRQADYAKAAALGEESVRVYQEAGDRSGLSAALTSLARVAYSQGDFDRMAALQEESLNLYRELGDKPGIAASLANLGLVAKERGDYPRAMALQEESLALRRELGDKKSIAALLNNLGVVAYEQGDDARAMALYEESLSLKRELGDTWGIAMTLENRADVACRQGDLAHARAWYGESLVLSRALGDKRNAAYCLEGLAGVACGVGWLERAARLCGAAAALRATIGAPLPPAERTDFDRARAAARAGLGDDAFNAAWTAGQALSPEQAIALALEEAVAV